MRALRRRTRIAPLAALGLLCACGSGPPDLLLISVDTLRPDHLGCYGYARDTSPHIDALAHRGAVFENALSTSSWTLPAHASLLTGVYPPAHGLRDDGIRLPETVATVAQALRARGYRTSAVVSHVYVSSQFGLDRGFDVFDDSLIAEGTTNPVAGQVVDRVLTLLEEADPDAPRFTFVHFFDPHWSYTPPPPFAARFTDPGYRGPIDGSSARMWPYLDAPMPAPDRRQLIGYYDGEIAYLDAQIGRLLAELEGRGRAADTVVVLTADHGEEFKEHGRLGHGRTLFGEQTRIPLIVSGHPAFAPGTRRSEFVSLVDVAPTLLELAGAPALPGIAGRSLLEPGAGDEPLLFSESIRFGVDIRAVQRGPHKLIHYPQGDHSFYFDLARDPGEHLALTADPSGGELTAALAAFSAAADSGWHLELVAPDSTRLRCRVRIRAQGRVIEPRRYFSGHVAGGRTHFSRFEHGPSGESLEFDVEVDSHRAEVRFETEPPDAELTLEIELASEPAGAGVFLGGRAERVAGGPLTLRRDDPRVHGLPPRYEAAGVYLRAVDPARGEASGLTAETVERLRALGYTDAESSPGSDPPPR